MDVRNARSRRRSTFTRSLIPECKPELRGWFSQDNPFNWDIDAFDYAPDIRRFDNGTPAILPAAATVPALKWHADADTDAILRHNRRLCGILIDGLDHLGLKLLTPRAENERGRQPDDRAFLG